MKNKLIKTLQFTAILLLMISVIEANSKACKIKLCGCAAEAKKSQSAQEKEYFNDVIETTLVIIEDIPKELEPRFGEIMDAIVLVSQATPKTEGYRRPAVDAAIHTLNKFSMTIGELQALEEDSKEYKKVYKKL